MITTDDVDATEFYVRRVERRLPVGRLYDVKYQAPDNRSLHGRREPERQCD